MTRVIPFVVFVAISGCEPQVDVLNITTEEGFEEDVLFLPTGQAPVMPTSNTATFRAWAVSDPSVQGIVVWKGPLYVREDIGTYFIPAPVFGTGVVSPVIWRFDPNAMNTAVYFTGTETCVLGSSGASVTIVLGHPLRGLWVNDVKEFGGAGSGEFIAHYTGLTGVPETVGIHAVQSAPGGSGADLGLMLDPNEGDITSIVITVGAGGVTCFGKIFFAVAN